MISRQKLDRWTNSETADQEEARDTHREIRSALEEGGLRGVSEGLEFTTRLQGSYRNTTMVYDSGDVDILVVRKDIYHGNFDRVPSHSQELAPTRNPRQMFQEHAEGVYRTLQYIYGPGSVSRGEKAIEVESDDLPLGADVVPCLQYRKFWSRQQGNHMKGIVFWSTEDEKIINYPRRHRLEGEQINHRTDGKYKPTIRIFKNIRNALVEQGTIEKENAASYYIECLLSNVDESIIRESDIRDRIEGILGELEEAAGNGFPEYTVQHGMQELFGSSTTQWRVEEAQNFVEEANQLYYGD